MDDVVYQIRLHALWPGPRYMDAYIISSEKERKWNKAQVSELQPRLARLESNVSWLPCLLQSLLQVHGLEDSFIFVIQSIQQVPKLRWQRYDKIS